MAVNKVDESFKDITGNTLYNTSFLKMFNILEEDNVNFLNIFKSYLINENIKNDIVFYDTYEIDNKDFWEDISYKLYNNVNLWWSICLINDVVNPFEELEDGKNIKILRSYYIPYLIREIRDMADL